MGDGKSTHFLCHLAQQTKKNITIVYPTKKLANVNYESLKRTARTFDLTVGKAIGSKVIGGQLMVCTIGHIFTKDPEIIVLD